MMVTMATSPQEENNILYKFLSNLLAY